MELITAGYIIVLSNQTEMECIEWKFLARQDKSLKVFDQGTLNLWISEDNKFYFSYFYVR